MKLLVETRLTQGQRTNDFNHCLPGELVRLASVCDRDNGDPDGGCGCARSFAGFASALGTTTAIVADVDMTRDVYIQNLTRSYGLTPETAEGDARAALDEDIVADAGPVDRPGRIAACRRGHRDPRRRGRRSLHRHRPSRLKEADIPRTGQGARCARGSSCVYAVRAGQRRSGLSVRSGKDLLGNPSGRAPHCVPSARWTRRCSGDGSPAAVPAGAG
ncbi:MAG TPA: hypothetical protein VFV66_21640 [Nonomuraea sp.]|nr:hypothetical protein [Nonomuraea sp.]